MRAAFKGYADAVADPAGAVAISLKEINAAGNQNYLTAEGETYRWQQESAIVAKGTPPGSLPGLIDPGVFAAEVDAYAKAGRVPERHAVDRRHLRRRRGQRRGRVRHHAWSGPAATGS